MAYQKVYYFDTEEIQDAIWLGNSNRVREPLCCACTPPMTTVGNDGKARRVAYQCGISGYYAVNGLHYCWSHKRMVDRGGQPLMFPPGPVKSK